MVRLSSFLLLFILFGVTIADYRKESGISLEGEKDGFISDDSMDFLLSGNLLQKRDEPTIRRNGAYIWKREYNGRKEDHSWKKRSMNGMGDNGKRSNEPPVRRIEQYIWKRSNGMKMNKRFPSLPQFEP